MIPRKTYCRCFFLYKKHYTRDAYWCKKKKSLKQLKRFYKI